MFIRDRIGETRAEPGEKPPGHGTPPAGAPLATEGYGGGWIYGQKDNKLSIGFVVGLSHPDAKLA